MSIFSRRNSKEKSVADYPVLLSLKFGEEQHESSPELEMGDYRRPSIDEDDSLSDSSVDQKLQPGVRDKQTAPSLRIFQIEKKLFKSKDLSKRQRRALQARKNTAIFRERKRQALAYRQLFEVELDNIQTRVSKLF